MKNSLRENILNELKNLLSEAAATDQEIAANIISSELKKCGYSGEVGTYLNATGYTDNVTESELRQYVMNGAPDTNANKNLCNKSSSRGYMVVDGEGMNADSFVIINCQNGKPININRRGRATTPSGACEELIKAIKEFPEGVEPSPSPTPGPSPQPSPVAPTVSCKRCKGIGKGCSGKDVKEVQDKLVKLGFYAESNQELNDSKFGDYTEQAVKNFQTSKKLNPDGVVGPKTCVALGLIKTMAKKTTPTVAPAASPAAPSGGGLGSKAETTGIPGEESKLPPTVSAFRESKFYDNKKLNEAKNLYDKLLKNI